MKEGQGSLVSLDYGEFGISKSSEFSLVFTVFAGFTVFHGTNEFQ